MPCGRASRPSLRERGVWLTLPTAKAGGFSNNIGHRRCRRLPAWGRSVYVNIRKVKTIFIVQTPQEAKEHALLSSPTIRLNGRDIAEDIHESLCESCGELTGNTISVDCREWHYRGRVVLSRASAPADRGDYGCHAEYRHAPGRSCVHRGIAGEYAAVFQEQWASDKLLLNRCIRGTHSVEPIAKQFVIPE